MELLRAGAYNDLGGGVAQFNGEGGSARYGDFTDSHGTVGAHSTATNFNVTVQAYSWISEAKINKADYDENQTALQHYSEKMRSWSGKMQAAALPLEQAFKRGSLYSPAIKGRMTTVIIDKSFGGIRIYRPLFQMSAIRAGQIGTALKVAGRGAAVAGVIFAGIDMAQNGRTTSNTLDVTMSLVAFIPGVGSSIAGGYFAANLVLKYATGQDIGQHLDSFAESFETRTFADDGPQGDF